MTAATRAPGRAILVVNPRSKAAAGEAAEHACAALRGALPVLYEIETRGDGRDGERIAAALRSGTCPLAIGAGGDGTVREVAQAILAATPAGARAPALAVLPLGTANNFARTLGLSSLRSAGRSAAEHAIRTAVSGEERSADVGVCGDRCFVGSFAVGMDAEILALRNRLRRRFGTTGAAGGYVLYLASCAISVTRRRTVRASLRIDGAPQPERDLYNLLVTSAPLYAGEFRFAAGVVDDGRLDVHWTDTVAAYVSEYARAWRRHVRFTRGEHVEPSARLRDAARIELTSARPQPGQIDGEELAPRTQWSVRVLPGALRVRVAKR